MQYIIKVVFLIFLAYSSFAQLTPFEKSNGKETATYFEVVEFYKNLDKASTKISMKEVGPTDAGYPLNIVLLSNDGNFDPATWHKTSKAVIMIINGIHPGEPDGIDASMLLARDIAIKKIILPANVCLALIPIYNIGGALNRNSTSRVNQNGPASYGFRGNSQNLDLNRDFTKCDTREARSFTTIFHELDPDILIDNHVSDGADYQYTMTLITSQYDKMGGDPGEWIKEKFEPALYAGMKKKSWDMTPYVDWSTATPEKGMQQFYDPPRYSSGYANLFQTFGFITETHMLKPFAERVRSTYDFMQTVIEQSSLHAREMKDIRKSIRKKISEEKIFPLAWEPDTSKFDLIVFKGYEQGKNKSEVTGKEKMFYDRTKPFSKEIKYYNTYKPIKLITKPKFYLIPQGWHEVIALLKLNGVKMLRLEKDSMINVEAYRIEDFKSRGPIEKHWKNYNVSVSKSNQTIPFRRGDILVPTNQIQNRYIIEMLEPTGDDGFFAWNFFDAILQQKEGYSDYRWEEAAADVLTKSPELKQKLEEKRKSDPVFANDASAQLDFVYKHSKYYEKAHLTYPVYRVK